MTCPVVLLDDITRESHVCGKERPCPEPDHEHWLEWAKVEGRKVAERLGLA